MANGRLTRSFFKARPATGARLLVYCSAILCLLLGIREATGQEEQPTDTSRLRTRLIDLQWEILNADALKRVLEAEKLLLDGSDKRQEIPLPTIEGLEKLLTERFDEPQRNRAKMIRVLTQEFEEKLKASEAAWKKSLEAQLGFDDEKLTTESRYGIRQNQTTETRWWDGGTVLIVGWGIVLVLVSFLLALHARRRHLRSRFRFRGKMGMAAMSVLIGCFLFCSLAVAQSKIAELSRERERLEEALAKRQEENQKLKGEIAKQREALLGKYFTGKKEPKESFRESFITTEKETYSAFRELMTHAKMVEMASEQALENMTKVNNQKGQLEAAVSQHRAEYRLRTGIKIALCFGFVGLAFVPLRRTQRNLRKEQAEQAIQCPRCLARGALELKTSDGQDDRYPEPQYLECGECQHRFRASYQKLPRLCFPTVGIRASGKTHWLVTAYDQTKNNRVPVRASIQNAPSIADQEFDTLIEEVLENHKGARPSPQSIIPYPLIFHVRDCDTLGRNAAIMNLFDYSGEMMTRHIDTATFRRRALLMDGFILFIDPTQVRGGSPSLKDQVKALNAFHEEMRDMRGIDAGTQVAVPIAVCISKLDLVTTKNPISRSALPWIKSLRESFARPLSLAEMKKRSDLCQQVLAVMFPGWNLTRTLEENFGGRFMFFPMTPVSLVESELGQNDLSKRTFSPVGIFEPICWLMHMHGFCIFP